MARFGTLVLPPYALSAFGVLCRGHRTEAGYTPADQAAALKLSPAEIAAIEESDAIVPLSYVKELSHWLRLDVDSYFELRHAAVSAKFKASILSENRRLKAEKLFKEIPDMRPNLLTNLDRYLEHRDGLVR